MQLVLRMGTTIHILTFTYFTNLRNQSYTKFTLIEKVKKNNYIKSYDNVPAISWTKKCSTIL